MQTPPVETHSIFNGVVILITEIEFGNRKIIPLIFTMICNDAYCYHGFRSSLGHGSMVQIGNLAVQFT